MPHRIRDTPPAAAAYDSSGDQAGSEAKLGVGSFCWFRPVMSIV
jgi:hypothetical protein